MAVLPLMLTACAGAPTLTAMQAAAPAPARVSAPGSVAVTVAGGRETTALEGPSISDADFRAAIEASLNAAHAFESTAGDAGARYTLAAQIVRLSRPLFGGVMTVELEVGWSLLDTHQDRVLMRKLIVSSGIATMSDALVGATRLRLAVEAAARHNVERLLHELEVLAY